MNNHLHRLVFNRLRGMLVAVAETATATGQANQGETITARPVACGAIPPFTLCHAAFGVLMLLSAITVAHAQIVPGGANAPSVIQTQNGLPQVNVNRPSGTGVSVNTYNQFDVQKPGAILNNSPVMTGTQQAGMILGNPNYGMGQSAHIIVNQVNSNNPSLLRGALEVAGNRAEVVIADPSGIQGADNVVDGVYISEALSVFAAARGDHSRESAG